MQIKGTIGISFAGSVENSPLEDVVVLVGSAGVALGVQHAFSARVRIVPDGGSGLIASRCVEIPLVGSDGEVSGVLCCTYPRSDTRGAVVRCGRERVRATADVAQFVVHDIDNLLAVIGSGLRLLECQSDAACRKAIVSKLQEAFMRGALLSQQLLDAVEPCPTTEMAYTPSPNGGVFPRRQPSNGCADVVPARTPGDRLSDGAHDPARPPRPAGRLGDGPRARSHRC